MVRGFNIKLQNHFPLNKKSTLFLVVARVLMVTILILLPGRIEAQEEGFEPSRVDALDAFRRDDYQTALRHYDGLIRMYPADPIYKYYSGVCLIKLRKNPGRAFELLDDAVRNGSALRPVPPDGWFFLGRALHLSARFDEAIDAYDAYRERVKRKEAKEKGIDDLIEQCRRGAGALEVADMEDKLTAELPVEGDVPPDKVAELQVVTDSAKTEIGQNSVAGRIAGSDNMNIQVDSVTGVLAGQRYNELAREALEYRFKADSLSRLAERYRNTISKLTGADRETVKNKILGLESAIYSYGSKSDSLFRQANEIATEIYGTAGEVTPVNVINRKEVELDMPGKSDTTLVKETIIKRENEQVTDSLIALPDTIKEMPVPAPVLTIFSQDWDQVDKIPVNDDQPAGLYYRLQVAAFRNPVKISYFKNLGPVYGLKAADSDITFYFVGMFRRKEQADSALALVRTKGFRDAFVVAVLDSKRVSFEKAGSVAGNWSNVSLSSSVPQLHQNRETAKPAEPPTLVYRVEAARTKREMIGDDLQALKMIAGNKQLDKLEEEKEYVYLIGKFITFESAEAYANLLYRNGVSGAKVVAYLGEREIPLETAKELFRSYFDK